MYELTDIGYVRHLLEKNGTHTKKALGQNFLVNPTVCPRMAEGCGAGKEDGVLEIGVGVGVLTRELSKVAGKVVCVEIDESLAPVLEETLADCENVELVWGDILKTDIDKLLSERFGGRRVAVCANLPYYITSPVMMRLLEYGSRFSSLTLMVQKEFAHRLNAKPGTAEYGALTASAAYRAKAELLFEVSSGSFLPRPKVDSAVVRLTPYEAPPVEVEDEKVLFSVIKAAFAQRRKMLSNTLAAVCGKEGARKALEAAQIPSTVRGETLGIEEFARLANAVKALQG